MDQFFNTTIIEPKNYFSFFKENNEKTPKTADINTQDEMSKEESENELDESNFNRSFDMCDYDQLNS